MIRPNISNKRKWARFYYWADRNDLISLFTAIIICGILGIIGGFIWLMFQICTYIPTP